MAWTLDNVSGPAWGYLGTDKTFSHTVSATPATIFVSIGYNGESTALISAVTYNGTALTKLWDACDGVTGTSGWVLGNYTGATGAHNVVVTFARTAIEQHNAGAQSWVGGSTSSTASDWYRTVPTPVFAATATPSVSVAAAQSGDLVVDAIYAVSGSALTVGGSGTNRGHDEQYGRAWAMQSFTASGAATPSWAMTLDWSGMGAVALTPTAASAGPTLTLLVEEPDCSGAFLV